MDLYNDKTDNPHWDIPSTLAVRFILFQSQMWINRRSFLKYLDIEIAKVRENHIPGINEYWDETKIEYLEQIKSFFAALDPSQAEGSDD